MGRRNIKHFCFLTDFGTKDPYVAEMKGKIYSAIPDAKITDLSHEIESQNIFQGAFFLDAMWDYWEIPSIHIAVVDPGVGTNREILVIKDEQKYLICPNNGLATFILFRSRVKVRKLNLSRIKSISKISNTFHGRDIMVPAGIEIAKGRNWLEITDEIVQPILLKYPKPIVKRNTIIGEIIYFDKFGNGITNISLVTIGNNKISKVEVEGKRKNSLPFVRTYGEVKQGASLSLFGSTNRLEIAINCGSAREKLNLKVGNRVKVYLG